MEVAFSLKEQIRASQSMRLLLDTGTTPRIRVDIVSVDVTSGNSGYGSAIGVSYLYDSNDVPLNGAFITSSTHTCTSPNAIDCARRLLVRIDSAIDRVRTKWPSLWSELQKNYHVRQRQYLVSPS